MRPARIVVVGGSIAAVTAVETLRLEGFDGSIIMLSEEAVAPYTRVPLSKRMLAGAASEEDLTLPAVASAELRLGVRATSLDMERRLVLTDAEPVPYDGLVIATGARARTLRPTGNERVLRDVMDARSLRSDLAPASSVLVIGGGFLGMEIASTCRELGKDVTVVDREPPLERLLGPLVGGRVRAAAREAGVHLVVSPGDVELIGGGSAHNPPSAARLGEEVVLEADVVVSAVGDVPNVEWLHGSGLDLGGGVRVDAWCRARPDIVAAGDVAVIAGFGGTSCRIPSWTNAVEQARAAARSLLRGTEAAPYLPSYYYWTEQFGLDVKVVGPADAAGDSRVREGSLEHLPALLEWDESGTTRRVVSINHAMRPAQLKRLVTARDLALATR